MKTTGIFTWLVIPLVQTELITISADLSSTSDVDMLCRSVTTAVGNIDILINNAGLLINKNFQDTSLDDFTNVYNTNVFGVARLIQICLPFMKKNGQVINISSIGGVQGSVKFPGLSAYSSSKGALITLTEMLAEEYKELKINFNVLALGAVQTEMLEEAFPGYKAPVSAKEMADYIYDFSTKGSKIINGKIYLNNRPGVGFTLNKKIIKREHKISR